MGEEPLIDSPILSPSSLSPLGKVELTRLIFVWIYFLRSKFWRVSRGFICAYGKISIISYGFIFAVGKFLFLGTNVNFVKIKCTGQWLYGTKYSRMDQVNCFKSCLPHISLGQFLNTLPHIYFFSGRVQQEVQFSSCHIITFVEILPCLKRLYFLF